MATLVSPLAKRSRLSLGSRCASRKLCDTIGDSFFPKTYSLQDDKSAFTCGNFYGQRRDEKVFHFPTVVSPIKRECGYANNRPDSPVDFIMENETFSNDFEEACEKPRLNISSLPNCGNTCYLNSVLHVLRYTPNFMQYLHHLVCNCAPMIKDSLEDSENASLVCLYQLHVLYNTMRKCEEDRFLGKSINEEEDIIMKQVSKFITVLRQATDQFEENQQHDAHEFLAVLITSLPCGLEKLNLTLNSDPESPAATPSRKKRKKKKLFYSRIRYRKRPVKKHSENGDKMSEPEVQSPSSGSIKNLLVRSSSDEILSSIFDGQLCQILKCLECEETKERQEAFFDLKVPLAAISDTDEGETVTLVDCLMKESFLDGDNKYFCPTCHQHNEAKLSYKVVESPPVLLLHLSWLSELSGLNEEEKCGTQVSVPLVLERSSECEMLSTTDTQFSLYAAIMHIGSTSVDGHYVALIKLSHNHTKNEMQSSQSSSFETSAARKIPQFPHSEECCCCPASFCDTEMDICTKKDSWYLFDDDNVTVVECDGDSTLPYLKYLGPTATPYMLFYQRL